jgi:hypothetical protein
MVNHRGELPILYYPAIDHGDNFRHLFGILSENNDWKQKWRRDAQLSDSLEIVCNQFKSKTGEKFDPKWNEDCTSAAKNGHGRRT